MQAGASAHIADFKARKEPLDVTTKEKVRELIGAFIAGGRSQRRASAKSLGEYESLGETESLKNQGQGQGSSLSLENDGDEF